MYNIVTNQDIRRMNEYCYYIGARCQLTCNRSSGRFYASVSCVCWLQWVTSEQSSHWSMATPFAPDSVYPISIFCSFRCLACIH